MKILFWLLPVIDIVSLNRILKYYLKLSIRIPSWHAKAGVIERLVGYLPAGFLMGWLAGVRTALLIFFVLFVLIGPIELYLMYRGVKPWGFMEGKPFKLVTKIFLLEGYNIAGYYMLGVFLSCIRAVGQFT